MLTLGNLTFVSGGIYSVDLDGPTAGSGYDQLIAAGTINLNGATLLLTPGAGYTSAPMLVFSAPQVTGTATAALNGTTGTLSSTITITSPTESLARSDQWLRIPAMRRKTVG